VEIAQVDRNNNFFGCSDFVYHGIYSQIIGLYCIIKNMNGGFNVSSMNMLSVRSGLDVNELARKLTQVYQGKGYSVVAAQMGTAGYSFDIRKDDEGIKKLLGMSVGVRVSISLNNDTLTVNFNDEDWTIKIIVLVVSLFLVIACIGVPLIITSGMGISRQAGLNKQILNDIQMIAGGAF
jgi:hypothetical protein